MVQDSEFSQKLYYEYRKYLEISLSKRKIKHADIVPLIERLQDKNIFTVNLRRRTGKSVSLVSNARGRINRNHGIV